MKSGRYARGRDLLKDELWAELREAEWTEQGQGSVRILPADPKLHCGSSAGWSPGPDSGSEFGPDRSKLNKIQVDAVVDQLERYTMSAPTESQTAALLAKLYDSATVEGASGRFSDLWLHEEREPESIWLRLSRSWLRHIRMFAWPFWVVSSLIVLAGVCIMPWLERDAVHLFIFLASLLGGCSVLYMMRMARSPMAELEATWPVTPVQLLIGRLGVLLLYDIALALAASGVLYLFGLEWSFMPFIISWLVPLCFSTIFALAVMLRFGTWSGAMLFICVWSVQLAGQTHLRWFHLFSSPDSPYWMSSKIVAVMLTAGLTVYVLRLLRSHRFYSGERADIL